MARKDITDEMVCAAAMRQCVAASGRSTFEFLIDISGECYNVCVKAIERAESRGYVQTGVSIERAYITDKGLNLLEAARKESDDSIGS